MQDKRDQIFVLLNSLAGTGIESVAINMAVGLSDMGGEVSLVVFVREGAFVDSIPAHIKIFDLCSNTRAD